jgi:hypothetical protein
MSKLDERIDVGQFVTLTDDKNCATLGDVLAKTNVKISENARLAVYAHCAALCDAQLASKAVDGAKDTTKVCGTIGGNPWLVKAAQQSFEQINGSCNAWFKVLEKQRVEIQYNQNNANVAAGGVATVLAAAGGHTRAVFNLATGMTLGNAMTENYKASFLFTPELERLRNIVTPLMDTKEKDILAKLDSASYGSWALLVKDIAEVENLCSHEKVVELINKSLDFPRFTFAPTGISAETQNTVNALKGNIPTSFKDEGDWMNLAALADFAVADRAKIMTYLKLPVGDKTKAAVIDGKPNDQDKSDGPMTKLVANAEKLALEKSDEHVRSLQRLADTLKWEGTDDFNLRKTTMSNWILQLAAIQAAPAPAASPTGATAAPAAATPMAARALTRTVRPQSNSANTITPPNNVSTTESDRMAGRIFNKAPPVQTKTLSNQIILTPK